MSEQNFDRTIIAPQQPQEPDDMRTIRVNVPNGPGAMPGATIIPQMQTVPVSEEPQGEGFIIKGEFYKMIRSLSEDSGEAQIFLVERNGQQVVLKIYYPNYDVNKKLMQMIHNFSFEMIVDLKDFGKTYVEGKHRFYELMEYLRGGTLQEYKLKGDLNSFRRIALQAAAALAYCHKNGILHKDVKPSNYFFRDENHEQVVLGDFGISSLPENGGKTYRTTQARTPVYAAPEMYTDVIDGEVEITPAADYYSLGITLFSLWLGENPMSTNERSMMKQKSEGRLPRLEELPSMVRRLIQGLTTVNPQSRWKYEEVERWFLGEEVPVDLAAPFLRYKSFIVDPDRNLVADSIPELMPMLMENERLAINYLYNGRITTWLENCGNTKLSSVVKDIIVNRYPVDQKAGLMAAVYAMDPNYPYHDVQNEACEDVHSISLSLLSYKERYALDLKNENDSLYLWLEAHTDVKVDRLRSYFKGEVDSHVAVMRVVYEIDPDVPFLANHASASLPEIVRSFGYGNPTDDDWRAIVDGRLLSWMYRHEDKIACESLRIMIQGQEFSKSLAYKVLYNLDRSAAYDLREANTPESIGQLLAEQLYALQHTTNDDLRKELCDYIEPQGRFLYYAQIQGWNQVIADATLCFDLNAEENRERLNAYDLHTAFYRFCRILGVTPDYRLPDGTILHEPAEAEQKELANPVRNELRTGSLAQWLSVFYHEDPSRDFVEEYSYERELEKWVMELGKLDAQNLFYKRFVKARQDTAERIAEVRHDWNSARLSEKLWEYAFFLLVAVWVGLLLFVGLDDRTYILEHPYLSIMLPVGGMTAIIVATRFFFMGIGPFLASIIGGVSIATAYVPIWVIAQVEAHKPSLFTAAMLLLTALYVAACQLTLFRRNDRSSAKVIKEILTSEDINTSLMEPLYYTFKTKSYRYKSSKFGLLDDISNQVRSISGENILHYVLWGILVCIVIAEMVLFNPKLMNLKPFAFGDEETSEQTIEQVDTNTDE